MDYKLRKHNIPISTLMKYYMNKESGKVCSARKEIAWRFYALDWRYQKQILNAFLQSGKSDREWAYEKLLEYWDESFKTKIKYLWESLHEEKCGWLVIRYFSIDYLLKNIEMLSEGRNYYFVCLRLAKDKNFFIDESKLSYTDYLAVISHTGRSIEPVVAQDVLYSIVHNICLDCGPVFALDKYAVINKGDIMSPISFQKVRITHFYLWKMNCRDVLEKFNDWNEAVKRTVLESPELKEISIYEISEGEYKSKMINIVRKYAYMALDDKYKKASDPPLDEMLKPKSWYVCVADLPL